jgi:outer membrane protein
MIHQARAATAASVGRIAEARSGYLPQVLGTVLLERTNSPSSGATTPSVSTGTGTMGMTGAPMTTPTGTMTASSLPFHDLFSAGLTASQLIYDFGVTSEKWRAADRATDSLKATEKATLNQALLTVRSAFFTARADKALVKVADETLANELKHLAQVAGNVGVGVSPEIDLATERTVVANDRLALIQAQNNYDIARVQLSVAMGVGSSSAYDVADEGFPVLDGEDGSTDQLVARAMADRPELLSLEKQREYNELTVRSIKGGYGPVLSAIGGLSVANAWGGTDVDTGWIPTAYVGASLAWPLFQGGLTTGQVKEAEGNLGVVEAQLEQERLQVRLDVEQARLGLRTYKVAITTADEALTNARYQLKLAEKRYAAGVGNIIELGDAQVAVTSASTQRVQADYNLATARAQLLAALGRP